MQSRFRALRSPGRPERHGDKSPQPKGRFAFATPIRSYGMWSLSPGQAGDMQPPSILDSLHRAEILSIGDDLSRTFAVSFPPRSPAKARNIPGKASVQLGKIALDLL